jgi:transposase
MMNFITADREQSYLLPPSIQEWLPENHLAWFILDAVDQMNLRAFYKGYREDGRGGAAFEPSMMVSLLLYAYCVGERSSRRIERLCETDVAFRVVMANLNPDHATIARFRRNRRKELNRLFVEILRLCREAGLVKMGTVALDGTKIKANAALDANRTHDGLEEEVKKMLSEAETKDQEEDKLYGERRGDEVPEELRGRTSRLARLKECRARLEREAVEKAAEQERKIREREDEERATGEKKRGRKPATPDPEPEPKAKANVTDPESRIMKTRSGYVQGYNAQAAVTEEQIIVAAEVTQEANDVRQLQPMMASIREIAAAAGVRERVGTLAADAGYWSAENAKPDGRVKTEILIATTKDWKQRKALRDLPPPRGRIPESISRMDRMERKLRTKRGSRLYRKRGQTVEPVFGQIKDARGFDRFLLRGRLGAELEWKLICGTGNLLKMWRRQREKTIH